MTIYFFFLINLLIFRVVAEVLMIKLNLRIRRLILSGLDRLMIP